MSKHLVLLASSPTRESRVPLQCLFCLHVEESCPFSHQLVLGGRSLGPRVVSEPFFWAGFKLAIYWVSVKMGPAFGQCFTILPLSSCRSGGWTPSGSRNLFTFSLLFRPGTSHGLSTISFNNSDLSPTKVTFRVGISPRFSSIR